MENDSFRNRYLIITSVLQLNRVIDAQNEEVQGVFQKLDQHSVHHNGTPS